MLYRDSVLIVILIVLLQDEVVRLSEALAIKEEEVARLREQLISRDATPSHPTLPVDLLQAKVILLLSCLEFAVWAHWLYAWQTFPVTT